MTSSFDLLVIGGSGFVGANLTQAALHAGFKVAYTYVDHRLQLPVSSYQVDLQEKSTLETCLKKTQPKNIVYCALPRGNETKHRIVSIEGVKRTLDALDKATYPKFVYVSSNSVFSGRKGQYRELEKTDAEQQRDDYRAYAVTRAIGEQVALDTWSNSIVVRTADVNGRDVQGNINRRLISLIDQLESGQEIQRLSQAYISPTLVLQRKVRVLRVLLMAFLPFSPSSPTLPPSGEGSLLSLWERERVRENWQGAIARLCAVMLVDNLVDGIMEILDEDFVYRGILHIAGCERITYYEFACKLAKFVNADVSLVKPDPSKIWDYSLDISFTQSLLKTRLLNVEDQFKGIFCGQTWSARNCSIESNHPLVS